jgi:hypothetical protein
LRRRRLALRLRELVALAGPERLTLLARDVVRVGAVLAA